ncbi:RNA-directed DNA polymerase, eukaryota, reverse transcriptase zinc-binding domain protein [Tanacetum coccineum]|uniref:RNA-directed DNA polymerase, eukaryota, reverse transcriptase zinc-binding domain protein n=1 Tax=Tanacetum coccineum TaxID=301880 RepID=A0ABQ5ET19_9ASTR
MKYLVFQKVKKLEYDLKIAQVEVEADPNNKQILEMSKILYNYNEAITNEEKLLSQKAKVKWLSEGDRNTKDKVAERFLKNFEKFLGPNGDTEQIKNAEELFINKLSENEYDFMELLKGYSRQKGPQRCALKIDIAKAYDTVNWGFLKQILVHFGFHEKIIRWIMACVTSATFSICINGERDYKFVEVLKDGLMEFSKVSGLISNMNKSTIFFRSVKAIKKMKILEIMPFAVGQLLMKYLGVPLCNTPKIR